MVEVMKKIFKRSSERTATLTAPDPEQYTTAMPPSETPGHAQASLGQSILGSLLLSPGSWCTQSFVCALQESVFPVLCNFWQVYVEVNGDLFQESQVYCTQSTLS